MRFATWTILLILLAAPRPLAAQDRGAQPPDAPLRPAPLSVGAFAGLGSGPIEAATAGLTVGFPIWRPLAFRAELSSWGNGIGDTVCPASVPESHRCSVGGWAWLVGLGATLPVGDRLGIFAEATSGRFSRNWIGDATVVSPALSLEAGARIHLQGSLFARFGGRSLRVHDDHYRALLGEKLRYRMVTFGLEYGIGR